MSTEDTVNEVPGTSKLDDAISIFDEIDHYRNLHRSVAIALFIVSAGIGVLGFFLINDLALWDGISEFVATGLVTISWVLIFPIWILAHLILMSVLSAMGIRDISANVKNCLSKLALSQGESQELVQKLDFLKWQHGKIFKKTFADFIEQNSETSSD